VGRPPLAASWGATIDPASSRGPRSRPEAAVPSPQRHILALNDSDEVLKVFRLLLEEEGYRVTTQKYMLKDMDAIHADPPDLIILDYMWAGDDTGWSMLQMLRMDRTTAKTPIILCTGAKHEITELGDRLTEQNVRVVLKPFDIDELLGVITTALATTA
jgi:CheY-like chemotaxis protein